MENFLLNRSNLVRFDPLFWLGGIAAQFCFICFGRTIIVIDQAEIDVARNFLASISGRVERERFECES